jgi:hypothetical protein
MLRSCTIHVVLGRASFAALGQTPPPAPNPAEIRKRITDSLDLPSNQRGKDTVESLRRDFRLNHRHRSAGEFRARSPFPASGLAEELQPLLFSGPPEPALRGAQLGRAISKSYSNFATQEQCPCTDTAAEADTRSWTPGYTVWGDVLFPACDSTHHPGAVTGLSRTASTKDGYVQQS